MSSILTNNSAMVALQTLKSINMNLGKVQSEISTGKTVESAKDNAAVWAISKVMSSDVEGFKAISDSLSLGQATVGVALDGAETITDLLTEIKGKIVNAQESNVDRAKIQTDIEALTNQITSIVGAAQFNGLNLLNSEGSVNILSSLDRDASGNVTDNNITVARQNLGTNDVVIATGTGTTYTATGASATVGISGTTATAVAFTGTPTAGTAYALEIDGAAAYATADRTGQGTAATLAYVAQEGDTIADITAALSAKWDEFRAGDAALNDLTITGTATGLSVTAGSGSATNTVAVSIATNVAGTSGIEQKNAGALRSLADIDVSTEQGADDALAAIEGLIQTSIDAAAAFGSAGKQIETQTSFVGKLTDLLVSGIGALVDADMEAASAKLQALQTQQQLGVQALSIANQAPQTILSLFR